MEELKTLITSPTFRRWAIAGLVNAALLFKKDLDPNLAAELVTLLTSLVVIASNWKEASIAKAKLAGEAAAARLDAPEAADASLAKAIAAEAALEKKP